MNTELEYLYRDAANYKARKTVVLEGVITKEQITPCLAQACDGVGFIPSQVGLEDLQGWLANFPSEDEHVWHEFWHVEPTEKPPTEKLTAAQLLKNFQLRVNNWDVVAAVKQHGL